MGAELDLGSDERIRQNIADGRVDLLFPDTGPTDAGPLTCLRHPKLARRAPRDEHKGHAGTERAEDRPRSGMGDRNLARGEQGTESDEGTCLDQVSVDRPSSLRRSSLGAVTITLIPRSTQLRTAAVSSPSALAKRGTVPKPI